MSLEGSSVYDEDLEKLMVGLKAKGIVLVVIDGVKNKNPIEYAAAVTPEMLPRLIDVLGIVRLALVADAMEIRNRRMGGQN